MKKTQLLIIPALILMAGFMITSCQKETLNVPMNGNTSLDPTPPTVVQEIIIQVSPNVLNIQSNGTVVTIHTDIPYGQVIGYTVTLNGLPIQTYFADNQGDFVAKFNMDAVKNLLLPYAGTYQWFEMTGSTSGGGTFYGAQQVLIVNNIPSGSGRN